MKKIITLVIAAGAFVAVHAQSTRDEARRVILGQEKRNSKNDGRDVVLGRGSNETNYPNSYPRNYPANSRQAEIDRVNRQYDAKIWSIRNNNRLTRAEKDRMIRQLEKDRAKRIRAINQQGRYGYGKKGKRFDDDHGKHKGHGRKENHGKHLGWEKGKGNPHKYGRQPGRG